jgi:hypothetical protein
LWLFPVIYIFWPKGRCCSKNKDGNIPANTDDIADAFNEITVAKMLDGSYKNRSIVEVPDNPLTVSTRINEDDDASFLTQSSDE